MWGILLAFAGNNKIEIKRYGNIYIFNHYYVWNTLDNPVFIKCVEWPMVWKKLAECFCDKKEYHTPKQLVKKKEKAAKHILSHLKQTKGSY